LRLDVELGTIVGSDCTAFDEHYCALYGAVDIVNHCSRLVPGHQRPIRFICSVDECLSRESDSGAFGGASQQVFGGRGAGNFMTRVTWGCAMVFILTSVSLAYIASSGDRSLKARQGQTSGQKP